MTSLHEFLTMGRFGVFVWPAFAFGVLVMLINIYLAHLREKMAFREVREIHQASEEIPS